MTVVVNWSQQHGGKGTGTGEFNAPWGVTVTGQNEIFACDNGNDQLQVYDEEGNVIRTIEHELLTGPRGICLDSGGRFYVTARNKILLFNPDGEYANEISYEVNEDVFWSGISLDEQGNIIVCHNEIHVLSPEGRLLQRRPYSIHLTACIGRENFLCRTGRPIQLTFSENRTLEM